MSAPCERGDPELVAGLRAGDQSCLAGIYDRYADRLYDFCAGMLRDRDDAADAVQDTFLLVNSRIGQLRDPQRLRPWLYAIARSVVLARVRARKRVQPTEAVIDTADPAAGPEQLAEQEALRRLVADVSDGLSEGDRAMLRLNLHGLEGAELAAALGISANTAHVRLSRLRDQVERALGALLVARLGRRDCDELTAILGQWDGRFTPLLRKRVARHVDRCPRCAERQRAVTSPWALLSGVVVLPAPAELRERVLGDVRLVAHSSPEPGSPAGGPASSAAVAPGSVNPRASGGLGRSAVVRGVAAVLVLAALAGGLVVLWAARPVALTEPPTAPLAPVTSGPVPAAPDPTTPDQPRSDTTTTAEAPPVNGTPPSTDTPPATGPPPSTGIPPAIAPPPIIGIGPPRDPPPVPRPGPTVPPEPNLSRPPPTTTQPALRPPRIVQQAASPALLGVRGCPVAQAQMGVTLAADAPATVAILTWSGAGGSGTMPMRGSRTRWAGSLGPFDEPGQVRWWVTASNAAGSTTGPAQTIDVTHCGLLIPPSQTTSPHRPGTSG